MLLSIVSSNLALTFPTDLVSSLEVLQVHSISASKLLKKILNIIDPFELLGTPLVTRHRVEFNSIHDYSLGLAQFFTYWTVLLSWPDSFSRRMLCETIANTLLTSKQMKYTAFPTFTKWVILSQKEIRLVNNDLPFINSCWLGFIIWSTCRCCVMTRKMIYSETSRSDWQVCNSTNPTFCPSCMWASHSSSSNNWDLASWDYW